MILYMGFLCFQELMLYLLQLVQAVRYENIDHVRSALDEPAVTAGITQNILDDALVDDTEANAVDDVTASEIPEYEDPADIHADLESSIVKDIPQPGEVSHYSCHPLTPAD